MLHADSEECEIADHEMLHATSGWCQLHTCAHCSSCKQRKRVSSLVEKLPGSRALALRSTCIHSVEVAQQDACAWSSSPVLPVMLQVQQLKQKLSEVAGSRAATNSPSLQAQLARLLEERDAILECNHQLKGWASCATRF